MQNIILLQAPRFIADEMMCRAHWHRGNSLDEHTGIDNRLLAAFPGRRVRLSKLTDVIVSLLNEAMAVKGGIACIWHPSATAQVIRQAIAPIDALNIVEISGNDIITVEKAWSRFNRQHRRVIIPPFYGEFGWLVMNHIRFVHAIEADEKIVCCQTGEQCLYPTATAFITDWQSPIPDSHRCGAGSYYRSEDLPVHQSLMNARFECAYPGYEIIKLNYDCPWHMSDSIKFKPAIESALKKVDIAICPRKREFVPVKNFQHWPMLIDAFRRQNFTVGLTGAKSTSFDFVSEAKAWDHPAGQTAGTVDILNHCRLYIGSDTGVSHLAALMDVPSLIFRLDTEGNPDLTGIMARANKSAFIRLPDSYWHSPEAVLDAALQYLKLSAESTH